MEKTNFTLFKNIGIRLIGSVMLIMFLSAYGNLAIAQSSCSMACNANVQVSLDMDCLAEITYDMMLNANETSCPDGVFEVQILDGDVEINHRLKLLVQTLANILRQKY